jgi:lysylphosphatidylglycerol synthetase-like protein (DUF2156 family)
MADTVLVHPNRDKGESKATKAAVTLLLVVSAALILVVLIGGWSQMQGMIVVAIAWAAIYLFLAWVVSNWNRGVLPVAAGMAVLLVVIAAVAAPAWFARDKTGFEETTLPASILGLFTLILIPVSVALIGFAMRAFQQKWNVEVEVPREDADRYRRGDTDFEPREPSTV